LRRFSAILLLLLFGLSLLSPLLASDSASNLPACCRRAGQHHCSDMAGTPSSGPAFRNTGHCPMYPSGFTAGTLAGFMGVLVVATAAILLAAEFAACNSFELFVLSSLSNRAHNKRGPPCSLSLLFA
jgi:hypothetical protein